MALPQAKFAIRTHAQERRRHHRVRVNLLGGYMLADRREFPARLSICHPAASP